MSEITGLSKELVVARVASVDELSDKIYLRLRSGKLLSFKVSDLSDFERDQVVTVELEEPYRIELAPDELWDEESWIGVVHLVNEDRTVVSSGGNLQFVPTRKDKKYQVGSTVEVKEDVIVRVLSESPLSPHDAPMNDETSSSRFRRKGETGGVTYDDFGGSEHTVAQIKELEDFLSDNQSLVAIGGQPVKGVLFVGRPGTGKTMLARIIANQTESAFFDVKGPEIDSKWVGESSRTLRNLFYDAKQAEEGSAIIFFDEIDSIAGRRDVLTNDASLEVVSQLLTLMDGFETTDNVLVIAATNRPQALDPAFRRPGRFDIEIPFDLPNEKDREKILRAAARKQEGSDSFPHGFIANKTDSWTPAELAGIWSSAARIAVKEGSATVDEEDYLIGYEQAEAQRHRKSQLGDQTT